jgi:hypothetical protein
MRCLLPLRALVWLAWLAMLLAPPRAAAGDPPAGRLTFEKIFPGSAQEYIRVVVEQDGDGLYEGRRLQDASDPSSFRLSPTATAHLFELAAELNYFRGLTLESGLKVARLGEKTFRYENQAEQNQVGYNYTTNRTAISLQEFFENIALGRTLVQQLEYHLLFDRLGILGVLREFEQAFNQRRLVDPEQFVGTLEKVRDNTGLMRLARSRAQDLLARIQRVGARLEVEYGDQRGGWYFRVVVNQDGSASYERRGYGEPSVHKLLPVPPARRARLFELAGLANYFEDQAAPASPGMELSGYRLTYEDDERHNQAAFSSPPTAVLAEIVHLTRQLLFQEHFRNQLRSAAEKDSLTLQVLLQEFERALDTDELADPKEFLPLLEAVAQGEEAQAANRSQIERLQQKIRASS